MFSQKDYDALLATLLASVPSIDYNDIEYCAQKEAPYERSCENCSLSHYGRDCHNNIIKNGGAM